ncbi:MAG TPA: hypothetical protein VEZ88_07565 [Steroidobacteraceae bacterium]|nr:hypothetical protein [Steroidobacteraceae bacterium]
MARIAITLLAVLCASGCDRTEAPTSASGTAAQDITLEQLRNAEYASQWTRSGKAQLVNGQYRESAAPGAATEIVVKATPYYAIGDLDGDGSNDAVIILESDPGGSGVFFDLVPVLNQQGQPRVLPPLPLGDRVEISGISVENREVHVRLLKHGPDDPQCCPSLDVTLRYRLGPEGLINEGQEPSRSSAGPVSRKTDQSWMPTAPMRS